jgi:hypothetical protein
MPQSSLHLFAQAALDWALRVNTVMPEARSRPGVARLHLRQHRRQAGRHEIRHGFDESGSNAPRISDGLRLAFRQSLG